MDGQAVTHQELAQALTQQKQEILDGVQELVRDVQTEILKAFLPHAENTSLRIRLIEATDTGFSERMAIMERRLLEIEKKPLLNPPAA